MPITIKKLSSSQVEITDEISAEEFNSFIDKAALEIGKSVEVEGFRQGKAPKEVVKQKIGEGRVLQEAAQMVIGDTYTKAVLENKLEPLGQPEVEILKMAPGNPLQFKIKVYVMPEIKLPDYKKIASQIKVKKAEVTKEDIENMRKEKERVEKEKSAREMIDKISEKSEMEIPPVLIMSERERMVAEMKRTASQVLNMEFDEYLKKLGKSEEEFLKSLEPEAEKRVKDALVIKEIGKKENIEASDEEIKKEVEHVLSHYPDQQKEGKINMEALQEYAKGALRDEKTVKFLEDLAKTSD